DRFRRLVRASKGADRMAIGDEALDQPAADEPGSSSDKDGAHADEAIPGPAGCDTSIWPAPTARSAVVTVAGSFHRYRPIASPSASWSSLRVLPDAKHPGSSAISDQYSAPSWWTRTVKRIGSSPLL